MSALAIVVSACGASEQHAASRTPTPTPASVEIDSPVPTRAVVDRAKRLEHGHHYARAAAVLAAHGLDTAAHHARAAGARALNRRAAAALRAGRYSAARSLARQSRALHSTATARSVIKQADAAIAAAKAAAATPTATPTPQASNCDPNYKGACLNPDSPDYDCEGGSGDGPDYTGPVEVVGDDHFGLDRDGDGFACEDS